MTRMQKAAIEVECDSCGGTGIYRGFAEPRGVGVVCLNCDGSGKCTITYRTFSGRKRRNDVKIVQLSAGSFIVTGVGPTGGTVSYEEFLAGKMPK